MVLEKQVKRSNPYEKDPNNTLMSNGPQKSSKTP